MWKVAVFVVAATIASAHAEGIVLETFVGQRPDEVTRLLAPFHEELAKRDFATGDAAGRKYEAAISRPALTKEGLPADFEAAVERGHKAWVAGRFDEAMSILGPLVDGAHANPGAFAQNQPLREKLLKALVALALSQQRKGDVGSAKSTLGEVLRSFPDTQLSRAQYGPDAFQLYEQVRRTNAEKGRGSITVKAPSDNAVVFINERYENMGTLTKGDLVPGEYRVFVQVAKQPSRAHRVTVRAKEDATVAINMPFDVALRTGPGWTGFVFANLSEREKNEFKYALAFAREISAKALIIVGVTGSGSNRALTGALIDLASGKEIRRASVALDPAPTADRVRTLAKFLGGDEPTEGIKVQVREDPPAPRTSEQHGQPTETPEEPTPAASPKTWMKWTGIAAIGVGLIGGGLAIKFALDSKSYGDEIRERCMTACSGAEVMALQDKQSTANRNTIISGIVGGVAVVSGVTFLLLWRHSARSAPMAIAPTRNGAMAVFTFSF